MCNIICFSSLNWGAFLADNLGKADLVYWIFRALGRNRG